MERSLTESQKADKSIVEKMQQPTFDYPTI